ncbi:hypothetical protein COCVIDRAFT_17194 [Bipolaris victoriae FI3]|uniref:Uncharacterized protein n=1 Tax=Bipolaris victoriae (strain FI3) TaxID=930091 RepID=W7EIJ9_BIPV3|nr:hypothetical protein COCVIDRAFT_17194 [Bipolaris victoriae FI3]
MLSIQPRCLQAITLYGVVWYFRNTSRSQDVALAISNGLNLSEEIASGVLERAERLAATRGARILITNLSKSFVMTSGIASGAIRNFFYAQEVMWMQMDLLPCYIKLRFFGPGYDQLLSDEGLQATPSISNEELASTANTSDSTAFTLEQIANFSTMTVTQKSRNTTNSPVMTSVADQTLAQNYSLVGPEATTMEGATQNEHQKGTEHTSRLATDPSICKNGNGGVDCDDEKTVSQKSQKVGKRDERSVQHCPGVTSDGNKCSRWRFMIAERSTETWFCSQAHRKQWDEGEIIAR